MIGLQKWFLLAVAVFVLTGCAVRGDHLDSDVTHGTPVLVLSESSHDFGQMSEDGSYVHDFPVKNSGNAVLKITRVRPG